jgi:oligoribonuclease
MSEFLDQPLVWVDLEMTGLDASRHVIVEVAVILTDGQLTLQIEGPQLVLSATNAELSEMDEFVTDMHTSSGLLDAIAASSTTVAEAEQEVLEFCNAYISPTARPPLAGNSVHADRGFIVAYMPELAEYLHYRILDVTSVKEAVTRWYPEMVGKAPEKAGGHRALADIQESIAELQYYRETFFKQGPLITEAPPTQEEERA